MANVRVARRYAEALMTGAEERKLLGRVAQDLELLDGMMKESREFNLFLKSPVINKRKKRTVFDELLGTKLHQLTLGFLHLLAEKGREDLLRDILVQFFQMRDERLGIVGVEIKSAVKLSKEQSEQIRKRFEGVTKKDVRLAFSIDKQLKGGFMARLGDTVFDGSVKRQLELLRERLAEGVGSN
ncbi:MAG: ATP synthase F1 subunit delta [Ignavibacteriales bacterium]|nr:ATP synthase F1 subunit delta [Ignavibacteriales bacterium]